MLLSLPKRVAIGARLGALEEEAFKALVFKGNESRDKCDAERPTLQGAQGFGCEAGRRRQADPVGIMSSLRYPAFSCRAIFRE